MNRPIKFRVWDKRETKGRSTQNMLYDAQLHHLWQDFVDYPGYELMQYTGLTDKNGKEIYEGDIVQYNQNSSYDNMDFIAKWSDDKLGFIFQSNSGEQLVNQTPHLNRFKHLEVVGNIFEHSELLK
jgi:uncharacterized phage protein (TIGR01671 family)